MFPSVVVADGPGVPLSGELEGPFWRHPYLNGEVGIEQRVADQVGLDGDILGHGRGEASGSQYPGRYCCAQSRSVSVVHFVVISIGEAYLFIPTSANPFMISIYTSPGRSGSIRSSLSIGRESLGRGRGYTDDATMYCSGNASVA